MTGAGPLRSELRALGNEKRAAVARSFFKTGPGEYGEGDRFLGIAVPDLRAAAGRHPALPYRALCSLLRSKIHEERFVALVILVDRFRRGDENERRRIFEFYLQHLSCINNWDLVDVSAEHIVGGFLESRDKRLLYRLAKSKRLWDRRIAILATFHFIRQSRFAETLRISELLLADREDLIHKAVGWMLREVGSRDRAIEEEFLRRHAARMPRTMLRYAIEKFPPGKRRAYLKKPRKAAS